MEEVFLSVANRDSTELSGELNVINASFSSSNSSGSSGQSILPTPNSGGYIPLIESPSEQERERADEIAKFCIADHRERRFKFLRHMLAMIRKRLIYSRRDLKGIIFEILLPILLVLLGLILLT
jgi:hypothetical protein